jgi:hypothetical protein
VDLGLSSSGSVSPAPFVMEQLPVHAHTFTQAAGHGSSTTDMELKAKQAEALLRDMLEREGRGSYYLDAARCVNFPHHQIDIRSSTGVSGGLLTDEGHSSGGRVMVMRDSYFLPDWLMSVFTTPGTQTGSTSARSLKNGLPGEEWPLLESGQLFDDDLHCVYFAGGVQLQQGDEVSLEQPPDSGAFLQVYMRPRAALPMSLTGRPRPDMWIILPVLRLVWSRCMPRKHGTLCVDLARHWWPVRRTARWWEARTSQTWMRVGDRRLDERFRGQ